MKTIKYIVDRGFRRANEVRAEEDAVADNLILRGFAEETDEEPDASTGEAHAVAQYHPEGAEAEPQERGGTQPLPAELNAPGATGSNVSSDTSGNAPATRSRATKTGSVNAPVAGLGTNSEGETAPVTVSETATPAETENATGTEGDGGKNEPESKDEAKGKDEAGTSGQGGS